MNESMKCKLRQQLNSNPMAELYSISYLPYLDDSHALKERIKAMGASCYNYNPGNWLIVSEMSPSQIYDRLSQGEPLSMLIIATKLDYWGRMNKALWEWLTSISHQLL